MKRNKDKTKIYGFFLSPSGTTGGWGWGVAITAIGDIIRVGVSNGERSAIRGLGMDGVSDRGHDEYAALCPEGWETEFIHIKANAEKRAMLYSILRNSKQGIETLMQWGE